MTDDSTPILTVGQLRDALASLSDDDPVLVQAWGQDEEAAGSVTVRTYATGNATVCIEERRQIVFP